jgi:hypothetical protein
MGIEPIKLSRGEITSTKHLFSIDLVITD